MATKVRIQDGPNHDLAKEFFEIGEPISNRRYPKALQQTWDDVSGDDRDFFQEILAEFVRRRLPKSKGTKATKRAPRRKGAGK